MLPLSGALGSNSAAVSARHELRWRLQSCRISFRLTWGSAAPHTELSYRLQIALQVFAPRSAASPMSHR